MHGSPRRRRGPSPRLLLRRSALGSLLPGAEIWVTGDNGSRRRFLVQGVERYLAREAPLDRVFGPSGDANLNLVSCIGNFDPATRSYDGRIVVYTRWDGISR